MFIKDYKLKESLEDQPVEYLEKFMEVSDSISDFFIRTDADSFINTFSSLIDHYEDHIKKLEFEDDNFNRVKDNLRYVYIETNFIHKLIVFYHFLFDKTTKKENSEKLSYLIKDHIERDFNNIHILYSTILLEGKCDIDVLFDIKKNERYEYLFNLLVNFLLKDIHESLINFTFKSIDVETVVKIIVLYIFKSFNIKKIIDANEDSKFIDPFFFTALGIVFFSYFTLFITTFGEGVKTEEALKGE